jgi:predicted small lipoprotein YifL
VKTALLIAPFLIALVLLASCGKKGSPNPPGPANEVSYPRTYPSR